MLNTIRIHTGMISTIMANSPILGIPMLDKGCGPPMLNNPVLTTAKFSRNVFSVAILNTDVLNMMILSTYVLIVAMRSHIMQTKATLSLAHTLSIIAIQQSGMKKWCVQHRGAKHSDAEHQCVYHSDD